MLEYVIDCMGLMFSYGILSDFFAVSAVCGVVLVVRFLFSSKESVIL